MPALAKNYTVIAPDLRGLGDSSKPPTGYDGKTVAEDIHQLVTQLGFKTIFLVGHDIGTFIAYAYTACTSYRSKEVSSHGIPRFQDSFAPGRPPYGGSYSIKHQMQIEALSTRKRAEYLSWFYQNLAYNPAAITQADISTNMLAIILLQVECMQDLSIIELFHRMRFKI